MPRWASRLSLKITEVWAERLKDISDKDLQDEGFFFRGDCPYCEGGGFEWIDGAEPGLSGYDYRQPCRCSLLDFLYYWDSLYKKKPEYQSKANPWVWVYRFERVDA